MMATEYTPNYNLDLYASADKPNLRDQYNAAMGKIDTQMKKSADDVTNANANVLTLQTQVTEAQKDISALESTVETHGTQITDVQKTADDALSLAKTNEGDIADTQADVTSLTGRVTAVEGAAKKNETGIASLDTRMDAAEGNITEAQNDIDGLQTAVNEKAPINHASTANTYGQGSSTNFGHLKVTDTAGETAASTGTATSPKGVQNAIKEWLTPTIVQLPNPSAGSWAQGLRQCAVYKKWKMIKFTFNLTLPGSNNPEYVTIAKCSQLGIPNPSSDRTLYATARAYTAGVNGQAYIGNMSVTTNGDIRADGWNTLGTSKVHWQQVTSIQVMIDYSTW
mgnify:CR=1 FL=1|jgi:hypothetical protein